jgi:hypothetical protein
MQLKKEESLLLKICPILIILASLIAMNSSGILWIGEPKLPTKCDQH